MKIDVIVPTYNRSALVRKTLDSLMRAKVPDGMEVTIIVVDNNSVDDTEAVVKKFPVVYVRELKQGLSSARNRGVMAGTSELIGFIDDDEEVDEHWFDVIHREFQDPAVRFIGGPCLPNWEASIPSWLPPGYNGALGVITPKQRGTMDASFSGNLNGGNAVIRRNVFDEVGLYSTKLGRSGKGLLSEEDAEFYERLQSHKVYGLHIPDLIIYHYIPRSRLTKKYHRRWAYWRAVSQGYLAREKQAPVAQVVGVPRYMVGRVVKNAAHMPQYVLSGSKGKAFAAELSAWDLAGFVYGRHLVNMDRYYRAHE